MRIQKPQTLCEAHAQRLDRGSVFLSQRVIHIDQRPDSKCVLSTTAGETFVCLRVIMALQMPAEHLDFTPLPGSFNQGLQDYEPLSFCYQTTLVYDQPWWRTKGLSGYSQSTEGPIWETYDTSSYDDGVYTLTCIVAGESGHELWNKNLIERRDTILTHLKDVFSMYTAIPDPVLRIEPKGTVLTRSISNITGPEGLVIADGWKVKGRVHFAAPGLKFMRKSHLEAALCLGSRVAEEIRTSVMSMEETILSKL
ncbi:amine oxidase [Fusarium longipes]|uniref:monoamine oxidase n=1 Tax=Fusarium longipes TaxID=694270 RepID=A0A395SS08_9HYPO|nr:amine oxidase [Fusarium longipes]